MRATEMHDLLAECRKIIENGDYWHPGRGQFAGVVYCGYCNYSRSHGHGPDCILVRLGRATVTEGESQ